jgi:mono/diheme cytochrome c family protein
MSTAAKDQKVFEKAEEVKEVPEGEVKAALQSTGESLFKQHCKTCHKNGGNIINKAKPIGRASLAERGISSPEDIVRVMRNPGPKMKKYDESMIPDKEALSIGQYILDTFK